MVLVFILLAILILILTFVIFIFLSTYRIEIQNAYLSNMNEKRDTKAKFKIILAFYLFNKIKWLSLKLDETRIKNLYSKIKLENLDLKKLEKDFNLEYFKLLGKAEVRYFDLKAKLGLVSPISTAFLVSVFSAIISIWLPHVAVNFKKENYKYIIEPVYKNKNLYKIEFNCIIQVKMVHIINVIYLIVKKGRSDENGRTTSNRRPYGYSYE